MLTCLVPALFTFYIQDVLNNSGAKGLITGVKGGEAVPVHAKAYVQYTYSNTRS